MRSALQLLCTTVLAIVISGSAGADDKKPAPEGEWVQLFNGKDLTGWKMVNPPSGQFSKLIERTEDGKVIAYIGVGKDGKEHTLWRVEGGMIVGGGPASHLFTVRGDYKNFRYRVEAKINDKGNSGQYSRAKFEGGFPAGYEAQINATGGDPIKTGSLYPDGRTKLKEYRKEIAVVLNKAAHEPDEFFTQEVVMTGSRIQILVNGKQTLDWTDPNETFKSGHFALQGHDPGSVMTFRKVEVMELK
jgi:Domain of Unknown Function (DUF1080)